MSKPADWLAHAESDLTIARLGSASEKVLPSQVCFHAQQAAEKAIKAVMLHHQVDFPLIHDIEELLEIAEDHHLAIPSEIFRAVSLTPFAVETRYPGFHQEISREEADQAIVLASVVLAWAKETIK